MASFRAIRSFVVRALHDRPDDNTEPGWRGQISDVETGERQGWTEPLEISKFVESRLRSHEENVAVASSADSTAPTTGRATLAGVQLDSAMASPAMTVVLTDMLGVLGTRLPTPAPPLPDPNVTLERVEEKPVGLGGMRGLESTSPLGPQTLKGGRLDARVRFQIWADTPTDVDNAVVVLQGTMLEDKDDLRVDGFLKIAASHTSMAEHVPTLNGWRKTASYDVLYEYQYRDSDDAPSLIARIPVLTDLNQAGSPERETETVTDELVRWDDEGSATLTVLGPTSVERIDVLAFVTAAPIGGTVTILRTTSDAVGPPVSHPDLPTFLAAVSGVDATDNHAEVSLSPAAFLAGLSALGDPIELGDWDENAIADIYTGHRLTVTPGIELTTGDRFSISHSDVGGLDQQAVFYIRVNAP